MQRGFTLIEAAIVIAAIGILSAMAMPKLNQTLADRDLDNSARILASGLRELQQNCLNTTPSGPFPSMHFYKYAPKAGYFIKMAGNVKESVYFANTVEISYCPGLISFGTNGRPTTAATITLNSIKTKKLKYVIIATTGRVRISDQPDLESLETSTKL